MIKPHRAKATWEGKWSLSSQISGHAPSLMEIRAETKAETWGQELKPRLWRDVVHWLASRGLFSLLSHTTQNHPLRAGTAHSGLALLH